VKWTDRGYWVSTLYKYQSLLYWAAYSIYFRSITFFSAANPAIHLGGMLDDTKTAIYKIVQKKYLPITIVVTQDDDIISKVEFAELSYPVIVKPNVGFKGFMVRRIDDSEELIKVSKAFGNREMLIQEFISYEREYSIMCYKLNQETGYKISSFVEKSLPFIIGDGSSTIGQLISKLKSPFLNKELINDKFRERLDEVLPIEHQLIIDHVGNYARGSKFYNRSKEIDNQLHIAINDFFSGMEGLKFGRLDIKASSIGDVKKGNFKLLEINGAKAEPIHIYDPEMSFMEIIKDISFHWKTLFTIVKENRDHKVPTTAEGLRSFRSLKKAVNS